MLSSMVPMVSTGSDRPGLTLLVVRYVCPGLTLSIICLKSINAIPQQMYRIYTHNILQPAFCYIMSHPVSLHNRGMMKTPNPSDL
jgi:hypothetical protein